MYHAENTTTTSTLAVRVCFLGLLLATVWLQGKMKSDAASRRKQQSMPIVGSADPFAASTEDYFFFNRVQKTGSENFVFLLQQLSGRNNFSHQRLWSRHTLTSAAAQVGDFPSHVCLCVCVGYKG